MIDVCNTVITSPHIRMCIITLDACWLCVPSVCVCACVRACVCACVRACVCEGGGGVCYTCAVAFCRRLS